MDAERNTVIDGCYGIKEEASLQLKAFLEPLIARGLDPVACTMDGIPQVMQTIKLLWAGIQIQRCVVHIRRQGLSWCRHNPERIDAQQSIPRTSIRAVGGAGLRHADGPYIHAVNPAGRDKIGMPSSIIEYCSYPNANDDHNDSYTF